MYGDASPPPGFSAGHFTQIVWKGSRELGVGTAVDGRGTFKLVLRYSPAGNVRGAYGENVLPPDEEAREEILKEVEEELGPGKNRVKKITAINKPVWTIISFGEKVGNDLYLPCTILYIPRWH